MRWLRKGRGVTFIIFLMVRVMEVWEELEDVLDDTNRRTVRKSGSSKLGCFTEKEEERQDYGAWQSLEVLGGYGTR